MRIPKYVRVAGIALAILLMLFVMFVAAFIFNPFEGSVRDMRDLVPRDIDFFARKTDLAQDFVELPEPVFWERLAAHPAWSTVASGPTLESLGKDSIEQSLTELRRIDQQIRADSGGFVDLMRDVLGEEVILTARLQPPGLSASQWCLMARVSWRIRFLWGLINWGNVRSELAKQGVSLQAVEGRSNVFVVTAPGLRDPLHVARLRDCLMVANQIDLIDDALQLAGGNTDEIEGFGGSSDYRDDIEGRQFEWKERVGLSSLNAVETWLRPDRLRDAMRWTADWPDPRSEDMNERVLASFLEQEGWRFLTASTAFDPAGLTMLGKIELDPNRHTRFQAEFFQNEAQERSAWLDPFLTIVPQDAIAAAALRVPAGAFLRQMVTALDAPTRELLDDAIRRTGKYDSLLQMIDAIEIAFLPRTGFVFQRAVRSENDLETLEPSRMPHVAWVFWVREDARPVLEEFQNYLFQAHQTLGFVKAYDLDLRGGAGGDVAREYANPQIPGTGSIALLLYGNFFVVSNYGPLLARMVDARLNTASLLETRDYRTIERELALRTNAFVYLNAGRLREALEDQIADLQGGDSLPDPGWMLENRPRIERQILAAEFPGVRDPQSLDPSAKTQFEESVGEALRQRWQQEKARFIGGDLRLLRERAAMCRMLKSAYAQFEFGPQSLQWTAGILTDF